MSSRLRPSALMWTASALLLFVGAIRLRATSRAIDARTAFTTNEVRPAATVPAFPDSVYAAAERFLERTPAAPLARRIADSAVSLPPSQPAQRPTLRGILGGPPWSVVLAGLIPSGEPILMRVGDTIAGFVVLRIARDSVVIRGGGIRHTLKLGSQ